MQKNRRVYSSFSRGEVVYVDLGTQPHGVQGGIRPCVVVSSNASNHCREVSNDVTKASLENLAKNLDVF